MLNYQRVPPQPSRFVGPHPVAPVAPAAARDVDPVPSKLQAASSGPAERIRTVVAVAQVRQPRGQRHQAGRILNWCLANTKLKSIKHHGKLLLS